MESMSAQAMSIGIIGGADGPTSIFIAGPSLSRLWLAAGVVLAAAAAVVWLVIRHRKKNKAS